MPRQISKRRRFSLAEKSCSSASVIGGNEDLVIEILILLPAKSVVRFKSVSKRWLFLISAESFARLHIQNHSRRRREIHNSFILNDIHERPQVFICDPTVKGLVRVGLPRLMKLHQSKPLDRMQIVQSTNGLVLLSLKFLEKDEIDYAVFNPTTKQYRFIHLDGYNPQKICLFFDPSKSEYYKLLMFIEANPSFLVSVYDSTTHRWSHGKKYPFDGDISIFDGALLRNHIMGSLILPYNCHNNPNSFVVPGRGTINSFVVESNGHFNRLQLAPFGEEINKCCFLIADRIDNKWSYCRNVAIDFGNSVVRVLGMIGEESIDESVFLFHVPGRFLIYKFSNGGDLEVLVDYRSDYFYVEDQLQFKYACPFVHTFASV